MKSSELEYLMEFTVAYLLLVAILFRDLLAIFWQQNPLTAVAAILFTYGGSYLVARNLVLKKSSK